MAAVMTVAIVVVRVTCVASQADWDRKDSPSPDSDRDDGDAAQARGGQVPERRHG